jgi:Acetyltransferase (GNAT) domain
MTVYEINPLQDARWPKFVECHPDSSVFHSSGWIEAVQKTYGYEPVACTTSPPGAELKNGLVFCRIRSWLTGNRIVSLPFSDHCQPLVDTPQVLAALIEYCKRSLRRNGWRYLELRPSSPGTLALDPTLSLTKTESYYLHTVDLGPDLDTLFRSFHKSCVQRKINRAEREQLTYEEGHSDALLEKFYHLLLITRRRHGLPPQPLIWFKNLVKSLGDKLAILVASKDARPVASILTIVHKKSLVYKYGCSDSQFHNLGGTLMLHWRAIRAAKQGGILEYDLGRSEPDNEGLVSFKDNWGAKKSILEYFRYSSGNTANAVSPRRKRAFETVFSRMPNSILIAAGRLLYRHIG